MKRILLGATLLALSACTWSNSLYRARRLSDDAIYLERNGRPFEAASVWARAGVKADSAFVRDPDGQHRAEALWLRGRARARSGDCPLAMQSLEAASVAAPTAPWRELLDLELGRCLQLAGQPRALQYFERLRESENPDVRRQARLGAGRAYIARRDWLNALDALAGVDTSSARIDRATALVALHRGNEALAELEPLLLASDTTLQWDPIVEAFSSYDAVATDTLLVRLRTLPALTGQRQNSLLLAAARGSVAGDPGIASQRLDRVATMSDPATSTAARLMIAERLLAFTSSPTTLRRAADSTAVLATDDGPTAARFATLGRLAEALMTQHDSLRPGVAQGDMLTFHHAEIARDSLRSPQLASAFFARLERDWPTSPYIAKALIARIVLEPDSAAALQARLLAQVGNPYLAFIEGREDPAFTQLEQALETFVQNRGGRRVAPRRPTDSGAPTSGVDIP